MTAKDFLAHLGRGTLVLPLFVRPPKSPEWNGCVERANAVVMSIYPLYEGPLTVTAINQELVDYQWTYNHYRPHDSLDLMTPMAHYRQLTLAT